MYLGADSSLGYHNLRLGYTIERWFFYLDCLILLRPDNPDFVALIPRLGAAIVTFSVAINALFKAFLV